MKTLQLRPPFTAIVLLALLAVGASFCILTAVHAYAVNGSNGFPLDDPWIHLQFAHNLHEFGSFSYYRNEMATSGSTSPLYTFLLAFGFIVTPNEMVLSYSLGILFLLGAGWMWFKSMQGTLPNNLILTAGGALLLLLEPRLLWAALSGMETTLFIFLLLAVFYCYRRQWPVGLGATGGLLIWARPEALLFLGILACDILYHHYAPRRKKEKHGHGAKSVAASAWWKTSAMIIIGSGLAYAGFNLALSGSVLPNTYAAKIKYYAGGGGTFPVDVFRFLTSEHMSVLAGGALLGILRVVTTLVRRAYSPMLISFLWCILLFLAYWRNLPFLYQEGRYLMPILPFFLMLGVYGVDWVVEFARKRVSMLQSVGAGVVVSILVMGMFVTQSASGAWDMRGKYAEYCKYISDRQVRTAHWISENLPHDAVVATHDVGALAYYGGRRIVDMVGLVSPDMIERIGSYEKLKQFLIEQRASHIAVLRNWFEIDNVNPLFQTDEQSPEIMEVFKFDAERIHFVQRDVGQMRDFATMQMLRGNLGQAGPLLEQAVQRDPFSARGQQALGFAYITAGNIEAAETAFRKALELRPGYTDAVLGLAEVDFRNQRLQEALHRLRGLIASNPDYAPAYRAAAEVSRALSDTANSRANTERYEQLMSKGRLH